MIFSPMKPWFDEVLLRPELYLFFAALAFGGGFSVLTLKLGTTTKQREAMSIRKGWSVPLLVSLGLGVLLLGFYRIGLPELGPETLWGSGIFVLVFFLMFRFPRVLGLPLVLLAVMLGGLTFWTLQEWRPVREGTPLVILRPLDKGKWEVKTPESFRIVDAPPGSVKVLATPGWARLTGSSWWIRWEEGHHFFSHGMEGLGWVKTLELPPLPTPGPYEPFRLEILPSGRLEWISGF